MTSKNKKRSPFNAPSQTAEKYFDSLNQAKTGETYQILEPTNKGAMDTDAPLGDTIPTTNVISKSWVMPEWLSKTLKGIGYFLTFATAIGLLVSICFLFTKMNDEIGTVKTKVVEVDNRVERFSHETNNKQNEMSLTLEKIISRLERLLDRTKQSK